MTGFDFSLILVANRESHFVCLCADMQVCYRKSFGGGHSGDSGDDKHDISSEKVVIDCEVIQHKGFFR